MAYKPIEWGAHYRDTTHESNARAGQAIAGAIGDFGKGLKDIIGKKDEAKALESGWKAMYETREDLRPLMDSLDDDFAGANLQGRKNMFSQLMAAGSRLDEMSEKNRNFIQRQNELSNDANYKQRTLDLNERAQAHKERPVQWADLPGTDLRVNENGQWVPKSQSPNGMEVRVDPVTGLGYVPDGHGGSIPYQNLLRFGPPNPNAKRTAPPRVAPNAQPNFSGNGEPAPEEILPGAPAAPGAAPAAGTSLFPPGGGDPTQPDVSGGADAFNPPNYDQGPPVPYEPQEEDRLLPHPFVMPPPAGPPQGPVQGGGVIPVPKPAPSGVLGAAAQRTQPPPPEIQYPQPLVQPRGAQQKPVMMDPENSGVKRPFILGPDGAYHPVQVEGQAGGAAGDRGSYLTPLLK